jgi:serine/threonine protein kinase
MDGGLATPSSPARAGKSDFAGLLARLARQDPGAVDALARDSLLTLASIGRVLGDLASDPMSFEARYHCRKGDFARAVGTAYTTLRNAPGEEGGTRARLRGALGFILFTIIGLQSAADCERGTTQSEAVRRLQELLDDRPVQEIFFELYRPPGRSRPGEGGSPPAASDLARAYWRHLDLRSLRVHSLGTTSFILRCRVTILGGEPLALKCVLFPYAQVPAIADATRKYADDYPSGEVPCTVVVHSSTGKWILMDFVSGPTLEEVLARQRLAAEPGTGPPIRTGLLTTIGPLLLDVLYALHEAGFEHGDLTPSNIIVVAKPDVQKPDGTVEPGAVERLVLIDLGRNHLFTRQTGMLERREAVFVAPEVKDDRPTDTSDLYSLGMILVEIADSAGAVDGTVPESLYRYVPDLARFIEDMIDANPANRLLIFAPGQDQGTYASLRSAFADELKLLAVDTAAAQPASAWLRTTIDLLLPASRQVGHRFRIWRTTRSAHASIDEHSGYLLFWSVISTAAWWAIFSVAFLWGLRDFGIDAWSTPVTIAQKWLGTSALPGVDNLRAGNYQLQDWQVNLPASLLGFSIGLAGTKYYQNILAGLTARVIGGRRAFLTEVFMRYTSFAVLAPTMIGILVQPQWWPWLAGIGYIPPTITSYLVYSLARHSLDDARSLSTVRTSAYPVLQAYGQWWSSMGFLVLALLGLAVGVRLHAVHDIWVYTASLCALNIVIMYAVKCVYFAPSVRGALTRAFIAGERWEIARRRMPAGQGRASADLGKRGDNAAFEAHRSDKAVNCG